MFDGFITKQTNNIHNSNTVAKSLQDLIIITSDAIQIECLLI
jgi:hypothetical protein